jgi:signal transduction histidine kinase
LEEKLAEKSLPEVADAEKIGRLVNQAISQARELARGLLPLRPGPRGLVSALQNLACEVEDLFNVACHFKCDDSVLIDDINLATHLYRIAQEAASNAIRHGNASHIRIVIEAANDRFALKIEDDGSGFAEAMQNKEGMGLRIMNYRANMIGGSLDVRRDPEGGTIVSCSFPIET